MSRDLSPSGGHMPPIPVLAAGTSKGLHHEPDEDCRLIRLLPAHIVNRIAAGEVVERPASAVKELVENAIDADARRIDVEIRGGGKTLIAVSDDGKGMTPAELELAIERHATSKLADDDLVRIDTLGFRGEALAALAGVSRTRITSRPAGQETAFMIEVEGGEADRPRPTAGGFGTRIEIRDLFFCDACASQIPEDRSQRSPGRARGGGTLGHGLSRYRLQPHS